MSRPRADLFATCSGCNCDIITSDVEYDKVYIVNKATPVVESYWDWNGQQHKKEIRFDRRAGHGKVFDIFCEDCYDTLLQRLEDDKS